MVASQKQPQHTCPCETYEELTTHIAAFANGYFPLMILLGGAGLGKSRLAKTITEGKCHWILGRVTPLQLYCQAYLHRDQDLVFDDVDDICLERQSIGLLKDLCQTEISKEVAWYSSTRALRDENIPNRFATSSRVLLILNDWHSVSGRLAAVEDRAHVVSFEPSAWEVHKETARWFTDQEVFDLIGDNHHLIDSPSMRLYQLSLFRKQAGLDWKKLLFDGILPPKRAQVAALKADRSFDTEEDRVKAFVQSGGSRATYFRQAKAIRSPGSNPKIQLECALEQPTNRG